MASITSAIVAGLQFSEAETAFRPWWDKIEDFSVYALFLLVKQHSLTVNSEKSISLFRVFYSYRPRFLSAILWTAHTAQRI